jgi:hypothetical protein
LVDLRASAVAAVVGLLAGLPGLAVTCLAALGSNALTIRADLLLSLLDMAALAAVWHVTRRGGGPQAQRIARALVALSMAGSLVLIAGLALARLFGGGTPTEGFGLFLALALNGGYGAVNFWTLRRWQHVQKQDPSFLAHSQVRLFADKLSSNLLICLSLALTLILGDAPATAYVDPAAGLALAAATAWWAAPTIATAVRDIRCLVSSIRARPRLCSP